jgi:hypothetical protein
MWNINAPTSWGEFGIVITAAALVSRLVPHDSVSAAGSLQLQLFSPRVPVECRSD